MYHPTPSNYMIQGVVYPLVIDFYENSIISKNGRFYHLIAADYAFHLWNLDNLSNFMNAVFNDEWGVFINLSTK